LEKKLQNNGAALVSRATRQIRFEEAMLAFPAKIILKLNCSMATFFDMRETPTMKVGAAQEEK
jgi:hypothetical protein